MILRRPFAILHVATDRARPDGAKPFGVIEEAEIFFDLDVAHIVPVSELRRVHFIEERRQLPFAWDFFVAAPAFHAEPDIFLRGVLGHTPERLLHALEIRRRGGFARLHRFYFPADIFARKDFTF